MTRPRAFTTVLASAAIAVMGLTLAFYLQQQSAADKPPSDDQASDEQAKSISQPAHASELYLALGLKDDQQQIWQGEVKVAGGRVRGIEIIRAARNANVQGARFSVRAARQTVGKKKNKKQTLVPARLRVKLDAPPQATVQIETSRGSFSLNLSDLAIGASRTLLDGNVSVERREGATCLTSRQTEDDFPALAQAGDGAIWLVYVEYQPGPSLIAERVFAGNFESLEPTGHGDRIKLRRFDGRHWHPPLDVTDGGLDVWRPTIAVDRQGTVCVIWAQKVGGDWELMARRYTPPAQGAAEGKWTKAVRLTNAAGSDFHTVAATDASGRVWLAWQAWRTDNYEILLASCDAQGIWSDPKIISRSPANDWSPAIATDSRGSVYVAWDSYDRGSYDVQMCALSSAEPAYFSVANTPRFEARPSLLCDAADRVWVAYEEGDQQWGKDFIAENNYQKVGFAKNPGFALYVNRTVQVKCLVDGAWKQPAADLQQAFGEVLQRNKSVPRLAADGAGGVWLLVRHHPLAGGGGETWHSYACRYNGRQWSPPRHLTDSANLLDNRPALLPLGDALLAVYSGDYRARTRDRDQDDLFTAILTAADDTFEMNLMDVQPRAADNLKPVHPTEQDDVARLRAHRVIQHGKQLQLLRGEFHRHTEYTAHRDQDGLLEDAWRYGLDAGDLDWMGNGDHDNGFGHEYMWWQIQKISDLHHHPPHFLAAMTYERSLGYPNGHRNVMMPRRGIRPLPRASLESTPEQGTVDTKVLYAYLKHFGGICASHTSGTNMGTDWRDNDPEVEPVVEIYQGHRHNYEHSGAPRAATAQTQIGGYRPAGFIWNALEKGYRLGFQSSSDHVSTHMSYAIVLAEENTRQAIIDAFKRRHCYAATDNILLIVRSGDHLMGDVFQTPDHPELSIEVFGTAPVSKLHVVRDNKYVYTAEPQTREVQRTFTDMDARPGQSSYYYVRVEQSDGNLAWASPLWITYQP